MIETVVEHRRGEYVVSSDSARLDVDALHEYLRASYWAERMPRAVLERAIANSLCVGLYHGARQAGFARAITDRATYAYLSDVFVLPEHRGHGLGVWLVECLLAHPDLQGLRRVALFTRDAQSLYARFGFGPAAGPSHYMEIRNPDVYRRA
jgi:GNAT superfamily N-acetyltransferase